jgi:hypothetical protein
MQSSSLGSSDVGPANIASHIRCLISYANLELDYSRSLNPRTWVTPFHVADAPFTSATPASPHTIGTNSSPAESELAPTAQL